MAAETDSHLEAVAELTRRITRCEDADTAIDVAMEGLEELFGLTHTMLLSFDDPSQRLVTIATHGYEPGGIGSETAIAPGEGVLGIAVTQARPIRIGNLQRLLRYGRTARRGHVQAGARLPDELPFVGLAHPESQLAVPVTHHGQVTGVLATESAHMSAFDPDHQAALEVIAALIGNALELERLADDPPDVGTLTAGPAATPPSIPEGPPVTVRFYTADGSTFLDGEYLVKGVPGRLLWKLLHEAAQGQTAFTNREVRLDPVLQLPAYKDNFESRLILLRRRLDERDAPFRIEKTGRGRFRLNVARPIQLIDAVAR
jgi:adenylate cyclase